MSAVTPATALTDDLRSEARPRSVPTATLTTLVAILCATIWAVSLSRSLFDPMGPDQAFFQYVTDRLIAGQPPYTSICIEDSPGIIALHWLSTCLIGRSAIAFRLFDAGWQFLTLAALVALGGRDNRRWAAGWLAAILYALAYYGLGYCHTGQREAFAVLPILLAAHGVVRAASTGRPAWRALGWCFFAGAMGLFAFIIKPPLGLCFGVLWAQAVAGAWRDRREGTPAFAGVAGLTAGFVLSAAASVLVLTRLGSWPGYWPVLMREDPRIQGGYITGHWMILEMIPRVAVVSAVIALILGLGFLLTLPRQRRQARVRWGLVVEWLRSLTVAAAVFALLVTALFWPRWRGMLLLAMGILLPALGSVLVRSWTGQSHTWRTVLLLACASLGSVVVQGNFLWYHYSPVLACASLLAANELVDGFRRFSSDRRSTRMWMAVCLAAAFYLGYAHWWRRMSLHTNTPNVLAGTTLSEHYGRVTRKMEAPSYATSLQVAQRVQELTEETDPIGILFFDTWLYYLAERPPVHDLVYITPERYFKHLYCDFMRTIDERRPKVVLARIPHDLDDINNADKSGVTAAVFNSLEAFFGPSAGVIRESYRVTEIIDDVCIMQPRGTEVIESLPVQE